MTMAYAGFCQPKGATNLIEVDGKSCTHQVAWPPGHDEAASTSAPTLSKPMAKEYPFPLDPFQTTAIAALEAGDSVLVAAHTSAGKTVVAQYALAMAIRDKTRVIYTSPLKALSNQKYREFYEEFADVGLMTGDVTINPNATCLVMTTEILRSMLYYGSEVVREVQLLVYDEIHYIKDKERGVVWEESIILLPNQCQYAFLSATIPNAFEFAQWIANTHLTKCHVVYTDYRPVPLQHYIMPQGGKSMFLVVDEKGRFREDNYQKAVAAVGDAAVEAAKGKREKRETGQGEASDIYRLMKQLSEQECHPVIVFAFSKRECEALAAQLTTMVLNDEEEQKLLEGIFWNAVDVLSEADRRLPQITNALPMLRRGVGVHHSGLLPIVKEVIEILFQEGLVKVLFATETFSTGLNMPAKCVVFASVRKFDGVGFRALSGGEYTQMSGRAGRRGLDDRGVVVLMMDQKMEPATAKSILRGAPDPMLSEFRLSYNMLLNILRLDVAELRPEALIGRSLRQWQMRAALPALQARAAALAAAADAVDVGAVEEDVEALFQLLEERRALRAAATEVANLPQHSLPFLQPGRLVHVALPRRPPAAVEAPNSVQGAVGPDAALQLPPLPSDEDIPAMSDPGVWGVVVNFERVTQGRASQPAPAPSGKGPELADASEVLQSAYIVDVLVRTTPASRDARKSQPLELLPHSAAGESVVVVAAIPLSQIDALSSVRVILPKDLRPQEHRNAAMTTVAEAISRLVAKFKAVPVLDRDSDMKIKTPAYKKLKMKLERNMTMLEAHPLFPDEQRRHELLRQLIHKHDIQRLAGAVKRDLKQAESMILKDELKQRNRVLRRLGYISDEGVVTMKGHVAAVMQSGHELVLTELLFNGSLKQLSAVQLASLLSCFVWTEASDASAKVREDMEASFAAVREAARLVGRVQAESGLATDLDGFVATFRPDLLDPVLLWATGSTFLQVAKTTTIFEGSLVRAIRRLDELLRQLVTACQVIGDAELAARFEDASKRIHRDVIFAASLYL